MASKIAHGNHPAASVSAPASRKGTERRRHHVAASGAQKTGDAPLGGLALGEGDQRDRYKKKG